VMSRLIFYIGPHDISTVGYVCDTLNVHPYPRLKEPHCARNNLTGAAPRRASP